MTMRASDRIQVRTIKGLAGNVQIKYQADLRLQVQGLSERPTLLEIQDCTINQQAHIISSHAHSWQMPGMIGNDR